MAGNQDRTARAEAWLDEAFSRLAATVDALIAVVTDPEAKADQINEAEKRAKAIGVVARTVRATAALAAPLSRARPQAPDQEDDMRDDERDDSPENLERIRAELESRLDSLHAVIEKKRLAEESVEGRASPGPPDSIWAA